MALFSHLIEKMASFNKHLWNIYYIFKQKPTVGVKIPRPHYLLLFWDSDVKIKISEAKKRICKTGWTDHDSFSSWVLPCSIIARFDKYLFEEHL